MIELMSLFVALAGVASPSGDVAREGDPGIGSRTAVAITLEGRQLPEIEAMQGWFAAGDQPLKVVAVKRGPAEVVVVRDAAAQAHLDLLAKGFLNRALEQTLAPIDPKSRRVKAWDPLLLAGGGDALVENGKEYFRTVKGRPLKGDHLVAMRRELRRAFSLGDDVRMRFVSPLAAPVSRTVEPMNVFNLTPRFPARDQGFLTFVEAVPVLAFAHRFADAVALAGRQLHASGRRRAVLVLIEGSSPDDSLYSAAEVAELLADLQVPVFVWSFGRGAFAARWSGERLITECGIIDATLDLVRFEVACDELKATLEAQRVVWLEGHHPPSLIRLTEAAEGIRLAGKVPELTEVPPKVQAVLLQRRRGRR